MALIFIGTPDMDPIYFQIDEDAKGGKRYAGYDAFLGIGRNPANRQARKEKRKAFWARFGENINQSGGVEGIGRSIDNLRGLFSKPAEQVEQDYTVVPLDDQAEKKGISTATIIVGSVVLLSLMGLGYIYISRKQRTT